MEIYYCKKCRYLFQEEKKAEFCPDCGAKSIRKATPEQIRIYYKEREQCEEEQW